MQLRYRVGGAPGVHGALVPVAGSRELALRIEKQGDRYRAFASNLSLGEIEAPGLASGPLRVVLGSTHHGASADDLVARYRGLVLGHDSDADGLSDAEEDVDGDGVVDEGESDPADPDSDADGLLDGEDECPLLPLPHPVGDPMCIPEPGVVWLQIAAFLVLRSLGRRHRSRD